MYYDDDEESQGGYDYAQMCLKGHLINGSFVRYRVHNQNFCSLCGSQTIHQCPECTEGIRGKYYDPRIVPAAGAPPIPNFCHNCGALYPWFADRLRAAQQISENIDELSPEDKEELKKSLNEIVRDTPNAGPWAKKYRRIMDKVNSETVTMMTGVIRTIAVEAAKKIIWPS